VPIALEHVVLQKFGGCVGVGQQAARAVVEEPSTRLFFVFGTENLEPAAALQKTDRPIVGAEFCFAFPHSAIAGFDRDDVLYSFENGFLHFG
jgi:hypothetical protein